MRNKSNRNLPEISYPRSVEDITHLSASSISLFEACPKQWAADYLMGYKRSGGGYAAIGTAHHTIVEEHVLGTVEAAHSPTLALVPVTERDNIVNYAETMNELKSKTIGVEMEILIPFRDDAPPILMYLDWIGMIDSETLLIIDHKSSRNIQGVSYWEDHIQPLIYCWAARVLYPNFKRYIYRIGYTNHGTYVQWESDPAKDEALLVRLNDIWDRMKAYNEKPKTVIGFPEVINENCGFCIIREQCKTFGDQIRSLSRSALNLMPEKPADRYVKLKMISGIVADALEQMKEDMIEEIKLAPDETLTTEDGSVLTLKYSSQRSASYNEFWPEMVRLANENDDNELIPTIYELGEDIFTVKVGGIDKLLKKRPDLKQYLESIIKRKTSDKPTVDVSFGTPKEPKLPAKKVPAAKKS